MTDKEKPAQSPEPHADLIEDGPGNSIVQAAYSAALFNEPREKGPTDDAAVAAA